MNPFVVTEIGCPEKWLVDGAASVGLDFSGFVHQTTNELISHSMKRHGDPKKYGAAAVNEGDFERIPGIVKAPDYAIIGAKRKGAFVNAYAKAVGGATYLYFEEVLQSRRNRALRGKTFYKVAKRLSSEEFIRIVGMNGKTDAAGAKRT